MVRWITARYVQQFSNGSGDYTRERQQRPEEDVDTIHERALALEAAGLLPPPGNAQVINI